MQPDQRAYIELLQKLNEGYNPRAIAVAMRDRAEEVGRRVSPMATILEDLAAERITAGEAMTRIRHAT